jgi:hypothetical protein
MFLFGGGSGQAASGVPIEIQKMIQEKDEEIAELRAHVQALQEAMNKDMDDFEQASMQKNKVIEEQQKMIEDIRSGSNPATPVAASVSSLSLAPQESPEHGAGEAVLALQEQLRRADEEIGILREANSVLQHQAPGAEDAEKAKEEALELRSRLADAIMRLQSSMVVTSSAAINEIELVLAEGERVDHSSPRERSAKLGMAGQLKKFVRAAGLSVMAYRRAMSCIELMASSLRYYPRPRSWNFFSRVRYRQPLGFEEQLLNLLRQSIMAE